MLFPEEDTPLLKKWIMNRLADTDADADVLADYVLALLRHDADADTVRQLCLTETADFLRDDSDKFVKDIFETIQYKLYLPGATLPTLQQPQTFAPPSGPSNQQSYGSLGGMPGNNLGPMNGSRKRSYHDRGDGVAQDRGYQGGDINGRQFKQPRRGGAGGMGRGGYENHQNGRGGFRGPQQMHNSSQNFPQIPPIPNAPGFPNLDPSNPMSALLALQSMGFPLPGMPQPSMSPPGSQQQHNGRSRGRCRDYDATGYCGRGTSCYYEHSDQPAPAWTPPSQNDEYNPLTSLLPSNDQSRPPVPNIQLRGGMRGGHGGARGDFQSNNRKNGRAEFSSDRPNHDKSNTAIVVENIPEEKFSEEEVRSFFTEFGSISEISMRPYKRLAIVKFENWDGANAAYKSPKVIFDNRFVKVYWYSTVENLPKPPSSSSNGPKSMNKHEPGLDMEDFARKQADLQKVHEEKQRKKIELESQKADLARRHEELIKKRAEESRKLSAALAAKSGATETEGEDSKMEGEETDAVRELKAKLAALEAEALEVGIDPTHSALPDQALSSTSERGGYRGRGGPRGGYRGRGAFVPRGRGAYRGRGGAQFGAGGAAPGGGVMRLDNRPKTISLSGVDFTDSDKEESLKGYLLGIGSYAKMDITPALTTIQFKERYIAESFLYNIPGSNIPGVGKVDMAWVKNNPTTTSTPTSGSAPQGTANGARKGNEDEEGKGDVNMDYENENEDRDRGREREEERVGERDLDYDEGEQQW